MKVTEQHLITLDECAERLKAVIDDLKRKTPEDKVREYYQTQKAAVVNEHNYDKPTTAIRYVLECLNIKIDGVW